MMLNKRERNRIYQEIVESKLDPAEFDLEDNGDRVVITHNSGSTFEFSRREERRQYAVLASDPSLEALFPAETHIDYVLKANVTDGINLTKIATSIDTVTTIFISDWLSEIRLTVGVPDYWTEMQASQGSIAIIQREIFDNTPFTQDEQRQISAQLQEIKNQLETFQLPRAQMSQVEQRLDELEEASRHLGRKDWLIIFITTISPLVVGDIVTPGVARHIFTMIINGLIHLFGGGPPQILALKPRRKLYHNGTSQAA
jgi:hypothetical protein